MDALNYLETFEKYFLLPGGYSPPPPSYAYGISLYRGVKTLFCRIHWDISQVHYVNTLACCTSWKQHITLFIFQAPL